MRHKTSGWAVEESHERDGSITESTLLILDCLACYAATKKEVEKLPVSHQPRYNDGRRIESPDFASNHMVGFEHETQKDTEQPNFETLAPFSLMSYQSCKDLHMHEIHPELLWLGHALDARDPEALFDAGITAVVDVAYEELPAQLPRQLIYCRFPINDGGGNRDSVLVQAVQTLVDLLSSGTKTMVACSAGMSRSPTIASFALAAYLSQEPEEVIARIAEIKSLEVNGKLWEDVAKVFLRVRQTKLR